MLLEETTPESPKPPKFKVGDRVTTPKDPFAKKSILLHGKITRLYKDHSKISGQVYYYPEVYEVRWDDGSIKKGYLAHGLDLEETK